MKKQANKITLGPMCDGNLSVGETKECDIKLNGESIGDLFVHADAMSHCGLTSSGDRYTASAVSVTIWPRDFGVVGFTALNNLGNPVEYIEHVVPMYESREKVRTAAQAKRIARQWVAEMVDTLKSSVSFKRVAG